MSNIDFPFTHSGKYVCVYLIRGTFLCSSLANYLCLCVAVTKQYNLILAMGGEVISGWENNRGSGRK